jgi:hypothetical protein
MGKRSEAHADAPDSLALDNSPMTYYQAANIYALTSRQNPDDKLQAFPLLSIALRGRFGLDLMDKDADFDPIRTHPDFLRLRNAARDPQSNSPSQTAPLVTGPWQLTALALKCGLQIPAGLGRRSPIYLAFRSRRDTSR